MEIHPAATGVVDYASLPKILKPVLELLPRLPTTD